MLFSLARRFRKGLRLGLFVAIAFLTTGCWGYAGRHAIHRDSREEIWLAEKSQVKVRNAQSRVFDTKDKRRMLEATLSTFQDLGFQVEVLDEVLGIVSGKKFLGLERPDSGGLPTYLLYDEESLVVFNRSYRTWGPFQRRSDLVRLTVTIRGRNAQQLIVRASAQKDLRPVEDPDAYRHFYASLEKALLAQRMLESR